jgi:hypothetical protein
MLSGRSLLQIESIMELLDIYLRAICFQMDEKCFQHKYGTAMGRSLSPVVSNIILEFSQKLALDIAQQKPSPWFRHTDGHLWSGCMLRIGYTNS